MASVTSVSVGSTVATLVFSGVGNVALKTDNANVWLGGASVAKNTTDGLPLQTSNPPLHIGVSSPDEIYAIADSGTATVTVYHNR